MSVQALLFDTRSIQKYIFSGNRLKTNIGASYIVEHIFDDVLVKEILTDPAFGLGTVDRESWKTRTEPLRELPAPCYVAYIGGGNALILFKEEVADCRKAIVTAFTKALLVRYPGLKTGVAMGPLDLSENFEDAMKKLYGQLKENQNNVFPTVNIPYTGLTLPCEVNGEAADFYDDTHLMVQEGSPRFFSQEVRAKTAAAAEANDDLHRRFKDHLKGYQFPMELDRLGQRETESDIAIIHIDGNQMGKKFSDCKSLHERGRLSYQVRKNTEDTFAALLDSIVAEYDSYGDFLDLEEGVLPIRPLILGGDDITFICPARLALSSSRRFMMTLNQYFASCAGIAILPTAYPFFRGYKLAEQACDAAKIPSRGKKSSNESSKEESMKSSCWLDFVILHGEQAPKLDQIRQSEYKGHFGNMHFGPYRVDDDGGEHALTQLLSCTRQFTTMPVNKVKELRFTAQKGKEDIRIYLEQLKHMGLRLPHVDGWERFEEAVWDKKSGAAAYQTPYVDAIEIMDYFVPELQ